MAYSFFTLLLIIILYLAIKIKIDQVEARVKTLQNTVNRIADHLNLDESAVNEELQMLIERDEEIKAIKRAREEFGMSLVEGKEYIDRLKLSLQK